MRRLVMLPEGWPCALQECRPGHFLWNDNLCFKDEYGPAGHSYNEAGEIFWGGAKTDDERQALVVQPVSPVWEGYEK